MNQPPVAQGAAQPTSEAAAMPLMPQRPLFPLDRRERLHVENLKIHFPQRQGHTEGGEGNGSVKGGVGLHHPPS